MAAFTLVKDRVEAVLLEQVHGAGGIREPGIVFADAEPEELQALLQASVVEHRLILRLPGFSVRRRVWRSGPASAASGQACTVDTDVSELVEMGQSDIQRLPTAIERPAIARLDRLLRTRKFFST